MTYARSSFFAIALAAAVASGCGDREPEQRTPPVVPPVVAPSRSPAEITGWPVGMGRALVLRLGSSEEALRLIVPELGDSRFADSALAIKPGDSILVTLLGHIGKAGDAHLRIVDSETGSGSCVTWPSAEIGARTYTRHANADGWRLAAERDSVTAVAVDSLAELRGADSSALVGAINAVLAGIPAGVDSALRGIPFSVRQAYSFTAAGIRILAAELVRTSSAEADPREERMFVVGESDGETQTHRNVYSRSVAGRADSIDVTELVAAVVSSRSRKPILVLSVEGSRGLRLHFLERTAPRNWRLSWSSVVSFC